MTGINPNSNKLELAIKSDIVDIISNYVFLTPRNDNDYYGKCPFCKCDNKFYVSSLRGCFFCFNCNEYGNPVVFLAKHTGKDTCDVLAELANKYNIF